MADGVLRQLSPRAAVRQDQQALDRPEKLLRALLVQVLHGLERATRSYTVWSERLLRGDVAGAFFQRVLELPLSGERRGLRRAHQA